MLLRSLREGIDDPTATGRMLAGIFAALARYDRGLMHERAAAAREAARLRGRHTGRPPKLSAGQVQQLQALRAGGESINELASTFGVSRATVYRALPDPTVGQPGSPATKAPRGLQDVSTSAAPSVEGPPSSKPDEVASALPCAKRYRDPHPAVVQTGDVVEGDGLLPPGPSTTPAAAPQPTGPAFAELGRWRRHKSVSAGAGVLESTPVFRGGMDTSKWQVDTEKDLGRPGVLWVAVDGFLIGSVERLARGRFAGRWVSCGAGTTVHPSARRGPPGAGR